MEGEISSILVRQGLAIVDGIGTFTDFKLIAMNAIGGGSDMKNPFYDDTTCHETGVKEVALQLSGQFYLSIIPLYIGIVAKGILIIEVALYVL